MPNEIDPSESFMRIPEYVNIVTLGHFFDLVLIAIFIIISAIYSYTKKDILAGLAVSSFITWVLCTILWVTNLVSSWSFGISLALMIIFFSALGIDRQE